jgi:hypothetical protein
VLKYLNKTIGIDMTQNKKHSIDMVNGPLLKNIFIFAIPLMFTNFFQMLFNAVKVQKPNEKTNHNEQNLRTKQQKSLR